MGSFCTIAKGTKRRHVISYRDEFNLLVRKEFTIALDGITEQKADRELKSRAKAWLAARDSGITNGITVEKCCLKAIESAERLGRSPKTLDGYRQLLRLHIVPTIGKLHVAELRPHHVESMTRAMLDGKTWKTRPGKKGPIHQVPSSTGSVLLARNFLRMAITRVAKKNGLVTNNVAELAELPRIKRKVRRRLQPADIPKILAAAPGEEIRVLWLTLMSTGLRPKEARELLWSDITVRDDGAWITLRESKTEKGKEPIPIGPSVWQEIQRLTKRSLYVFSTSNGTPFNERNLHREWVKALETAKVEYTNVYQLRKLFGTMLAAKVSDNVLRDLMRHTDSRTTKQFYTYGLDEDKRKAVEDL
ncbi:MAG: tyrosine-type recombinase/integrase [Fimbriimonas sp.]